MFRIKLLQSFEKDRVITPDMEPWFFEQLKNLTGLSESAARAALKVAPIQTERYEYSQDR